MTKKKCLVTGGAGFIGGHLVERLIKAGHDVVVVDDESSTANKDFVWRDDTENHKVDICDFEKLKPLFKGLYKEQNRRINERNFGDFYVQKWVDIR